jgi:AcrR family transcriptional regulator
VYTSKETLVTVVEVPTRRLLRREERHEAILHGAAAAFARSGFAATSMEDVAEACGVTKLIVYRHFDSKEDLYRAILQRVFDRQAEELAQGLEHPSQQGLGARTLLPRSRCCGATRPAKRSSPPTRSSCGRCRSGPSATSWRSTAATLPSTRGAPRS